MSLRTPRDFLQALRRGRRMLADGAVGSELIRSAIPPDRTVAANLSHPELVRSVHQAAIAAGAEIITSNTFGATAGSEWRVEFPAGIKIADAAARASDREITVMVSVYPDGLLSNPEIVLSPFQGTASQDYLLLIETAVNLRSAVEAVALAVDRGVALIAVTCHFQTDAEMLDGTTPAEAATALERAGAAMVGANCGVGPEPMVIVAARMRAVTDLPLLVQPNAGLPVWQENRWVYPVDTDRFAAVAGALFDVGASVVGGCCGTTPAHIAAVRRLLFDPQRRE